MNTLFLSLIWMWIFNRLDILKNIAGMRGFPIATENNKALAESLNNCIDPNDPNINKVMYCLHLPITYQPYTHTHLEQ